MKKLIGITAQKIVSLLDRDNQCTEKARLQMFYGLQNIIYNFFITFFILLLSFIFGIFFETLLTYIFFGVLRLLTGGYHCNSIEKCIAATTLIMIGGGTIVHFIHISVLPCIIICLLLNIVFFSYQPKGTLKNPYSHEYSIKQHKRLKIISVMLSVISVFSDTKLRTAIIYSMVIVTILLYPIIRRKSPIPE